MQVLNEELERSEIDATSFTGRGQTKGKQFNLPTNDTLLDVINKVINQQLVKL